MGAASSWTEATPLHLDPQLESERLSALRSLNLLDTAPESRFDRITQLAAEFFQVPIAYIAFIDSDRQWLKSRFGLCHIQTPRDMSLCQYTIHRDKPFIMPDTLLHPVGKNHPLVIAEPYVRFYAGVPLAGPGGKKIGTFCLVDTEPRDFGDEKVAALVSFAALVEREINLAEVIQNQNELLKTRQKLVEKQKELEHELTDAAKYVRLMLPPPLNGPEIIDWQFHPSTRLGGDGLGYRRINDDLLAFYILDVTGHGLGSALLAVTALELLRNPAAQVNFASPSAVIERLNLTFQMKDHGGKFFSAWYGVYSRSMKTVTYANAGHPPEVLLTHENGTVRLTHTEPGASVLGIMPTIHAPEVTIPFPATSELYLFTDGLYELLDPKGGRGSYDEFTAYLQKEVGTGRLAWKAMLAWFERAREARLIDDDVSLLRFGVRA
jgi:sigma-B regulation protein RsbU (phosphoserine phosphatase)